MYNDREGIGGGTERGTERGIQGEHVPVVQGRRGAPNEELEGGADKKKQRSGKREYDKWTQQEQDAFFRGETNELIHI